MFDITNTLTGPLDSACLFIVIVLVGWCVLATGEAIYKTYQAKKRAKNESESK